MRPQIIIRYMGLVLLFNALFLLISAIVSAINGDTARLPLLYSAGVTALIGVFPIIYIPPVENIHNDEGLAIVVAGWVMSALIGALPYIMWGGPFTFTNAWFESVSGFTTTGSSILSSIETLPLGLLLWRSLTHWIGGIGIVVFMLAVAPWTGQAAMVLYKNEISSLAVENFRYRTRKTLQILLVVYLGLTAAETLCLLLAGMGFFDALTHSFATIATGGFSPRNNSVAHFNSPLIESIIIVFMVLSGIHFALIFLTLTQNIKRIWKSAIVRYYLAAMAVGVAVVSLNIWGDVYADFWQALRAAAFQVVSLGTSTGFATADTNVWPGFSKLILILFSLQCACAGSTSGGIKVDRVVVFGKSFLGQFRKMKHPRAVVALKLDGTVMDAAIVEAGIVYIVLYLCVVCISALTLTFMGIGLMTAFSGSVAAMGNVGPGFGMVSSLSNFAMLPDSAKWTLTVVMLLGRLEIFGLLMFLFYRMIR
ncbi:MAG: potassium transporter TrkG [Desulfosalsimonas sp.]|uniref:TrkH family potassium uptake protein n=1 Tax=Desulfosalsimonas sp. TaxID=3073848 RepID=UPI003970A2C6